MIKPIAIAALALSLVGANLVLVTEELMTAAMKRVATPQVTRP